MGNPRVHIEIVIKIHGILGKGKQQILHANVSSKGCDYFWIKRMPWISMKAWGYWIKNGNILKKEWEYWINEWGCFYMRGWDYLDEGMGIFTWKDSNIGKQKFQTPIPGFPWKDGINGYKNISMKRWPNWIKQWECFHKRNI